MSSKALFATAFGTLMLAGCVNLAPEYQSGALPVPAALPVSQAETENVQPLLDLPHLPANVDQRAVSEDVWRHPSLVHC